MLGHSDPRLTLSIYTNVLHRMKEATAARLDETIAAADASEAKVISLPRCSTPHTKNGPHLGGAVPRPGHLVMHD